jgi:2-polyprenyl-3-methyl-5-hydroxy-6-metoxy-1,4-benzoquinol methylase
MDLKEEQILGPMAASHWYYVSKGRALRATLGTIRVPEVLDVGAGSGVFPRQLLDAGIARRAVCLDPGYAEERTERHNGREIAFVRSVENVPQRLVLMMDVLEHVDDDLDLLRGYAERMPAGGWLVVTVPAFQFLWSGHDIYLEHRRRYTRGDLETVVRAAGLEVVRSRYFFGFLFPAVAAMRLRNRRRLKTGNIEAESALKSYPTFVNALLTRIHDAERATLFRFNRLAGLSVFCLARRHSGPPVAIAGHEAP